MQHIDWLLTCLASVTAQRDLINIHKHEYQGDNMREAIFILIFFFLSCGHNIYVVIVTRPFKDIINPYS